MLQQYRALLLMCDRLCVDHRSPRTGSIGAVLCLSVVVQLSVWLDSWQLIMRVAVAEIFAESSPIVAVHSSTSTSSSTGLTAANLTWAHTRRNACVSVPLFSTCDTPRIQVNRMPKRNPAIEYRVRPSTSLYTSNTVLVLLC